MYANVSDPPPPLFILLKKLTLKACDGSELIKTWAEITSFSDTSISTGINLTFHLTAVGRLLPKENNNIKNKDDNIHK